LVRLAGLKLSRGVRATAFVSGAKARRVEVERETSPNQVLLRTGHLRSIG
jgi:hypothetical protein